MWRRQAGAGLATWCGALCRRRRAANRRRLRCRCLDRGRGRGARPGLKKEEGRRRRPDEGRADPAATVATLQKAAEAAGATFRWGAKVHGLLSGGKGVRVGGDDRRTPWSWPPAWASGARADEAVAGVLAHTQSRRRAYAGLGADAVSGVHFLQQWDGRRGRRPEGVRGRVELSMEDAALPRRGRAARRPRGGRLRTSRRPCRRRRSRAPRAGRRHRRRLHAGGQPRRAAHSATPRRCLGVMSRLPTASTCRPWRPGLLVTQVRPLGVTRAGEAVAGPRASPAREPNPPHRPRSSGSPRRGAPPRRAVAVAWRRAARPNCWRGAPQARRRCTQRTAHRRRGQPPPCPSPPPSPPAKGKCRAAARHARPGQGPAPDHDGSAQGRDPAGLRRKSKGAEVAALNDFDKDAGSLEALTTRGARQWVARRRAEGTSIVAPLVQKEGGRRGAVLQIRSPRPISRTTCRRAARVPARLPRGRGALWRERLHRSVPGGAASGRPACPRS